MPWGQEELLTICPPSLPCVGTRSHQSSWLRIILGSSDSSCVLKKRRDAAGKDAGRVGGKDSLCAPREAQEGGAMPSQWLRATLSTAGWDMWLVLQVVLLVLQVLLVPISCGVDGTVSFQPRPCRMSPVPLQSLWCAGRLCPQWCAAACSSTLPCSWQHTTEFFWGSYWDIALLMSCSSSLPWGMECWKPLSFCDRMPRNSYGDFCTWRGESCHGPYTPERVRALLEGEGVAWRGK